MVNRNAVFFAVVMFVFVYQAMGLYIGLAFSVFSK